jgi:pimeloyl-ACP methyl ester carboxylesterase
MSHDVTFESGFAPVNGAELYYEMTGKGETLVMLHAGIADRRMWDAQVEFFAQHYRVLCYDRRGYGKSALPPGDFSHRHDLYELLDWLEIEQAHLIGCSYGGRTALDFTLEYPQMVKSLTMVGSAPGGFQFKGEPPRQEAELEQALEAGDLERAAELEVQIWVDGPQRTPEQVPATVRDLVREMNLIALGWEVQELGDDQPFTDTVERLDQVRVPTLVLWGDLDVPRVLSAGEYMARNIASAQNYVMSGTAHMPNMERPEEFNRVVLGFLQGIKT